MAPNPWNIAVEDLRGAAQLDSTIVNLPDSAMKSEFTRAQSVRVSGALGRLKDAYPGPDDPNPVGPGEPVARLAHALLALGQALPPGATKKAVLAKVKELI